MDRGRQHGFPMAALIMDVSRSLNPENQPFFTSDILLFRVTVIMWLGSIFREWAGPDRAPGCCIPPRLLASMPASQVQPSGSAVAMLFFSQQGERMVAPCCRLGLWTTSLSGRDRLRWLKDEPCLGTTYSCSFVLHGGAPASVAAAVAPQCGGL